VVDGGDAARSLRRNFGRFRFGRLGGGVSGGYNGSGRGNERGIRCEDIVLREGGGAWGGVMKVLVLDVDVIVGLIFVFER